MLDTSLAYAETMIAPPPILVVDDDRLNRQSLVRLLEHHVGHHVDAAGTLSTAMEKLDLNPRIVLLDLNLPDGPGGQLLAQVRARKMPTKICILTGSMDSDSEKLKRFEADAVFIKPYHFDELMRWVAGALGG